MAQIPHADKGKMCPLHRLDMSKVCHNCPLWIHIKGKNPQSNEELDLWNCSLAWLPTLLLENSQQQRSTGAAVESFRNEMVKANEINLRTFHGAVQQSSIPRLIEEGGR